MTFRSRMGRRGAPGGLVVGAALCALLAPASAQAAAGELTYDPTNPVVGQSVTFTDNPARCSNEYTFTVDGTVQPTQASNKLTTSFSTTGDHTVSVDAYNADCGHQTDSVTLKDVRAGISGSIAVDPDPPAPGQTATIAATQTGGYPGYTYVWDSDNDGAFDDETDRTITKTFGSQAQTVRVQITDSASPPHIAVVTRTITPVAPPPQADGTPVPPPPPPPPCKRVLDVGISQFKTTGCFTQTRTDPSERWTTTSAVTLNGIKFRDFGQTFTVTYPAGSTPGHFSAPNSSIQFGGFTAFSGDIDWDLPDGGQGDKVLFKRFSVLAGTKLFGLNVRGEVGLLLGWSSATGKHYASLPLTIELPGSFRPGPDPTLGRATGSAALRVDDDGPHFDGIKLQAEDVWAGKLHVPYVCFSFIPAGGASLDPCEAPKLDEKTFIECNNDVNTDRWNGSAQIELPRSEIQIAAFGGLADGKVSQLGGFVDNLGRKAPITPTVYLNKVGIGLCLTPPPFKLRGTVGVSILPLASGVNTAEVTGSLLYTDTYSDNLGYHPWSLRFDGDVKVFDRHLGSGYFTYRPSGGFDFGFEAGFSIDGLASLNGHVDGWIDSTSGDFALEGGVDGCVVDVLCAKGSGTISSVGVAGCLEAYTSYTDYGTLVIRGDGSVHFQQSSISIKGGFGYNWKTKHGALFGSSCDFAPYQPVRAVATAAQTGPKTLSQRIAKGTPAVSLRIHGTHGAPKVVLRGPGGQTISSPTTGHGKQSRGHFMLAENGTDGTTNVLLLHPTAGKWTIGALPGATSTPTSIDRAAIEAPPAFATKVRANGPERVLDVAYAVPVGAKVRLMERGTGVSRTLVGDLRGHRCPGSRRTRPGSNQALVCARVRFTPSHGPGGTRKVEALVTRGGLPLTKKAIATFTAPRERLPARPAPLRARRSRGSLVVQFNPVRGASRYTAIASLSDGRKLGFDLGPECRAVRIADVPSRVGATVRLAGVRYDLEMGATRSISVAAGVTAAGKPTRPRSQWKPKEPCT